jgi:hypothetical protein
MAVALSDRAVGVAEALCARSCESSRSSTCCRTDASSSHDFATYARRASDGNDTAASNISRTRGQLSEMGGMVGDHVI